MTALLWFAIGFFTALACVFALALWSLHPISFEHSKKIADTMQKVLASDKPPAWLLCVLLRWKSFTMSPNSRQRKREILASQLRPARLLLITLLVMTPLSARFGWVRGYAEGHAAGVSSTQELGLDTSNPLPGTYLIVVTGTNRFYAYSGLGTPGVTNLQSFTKWVCTQPRFGETQNYGNRRNENNE